MKPGQNLPKVKSYQDFKPQQIVRYRFDPRDEWEYGIVGAISEEAFRDVVSIYNTIDLKLLFPPGVERAGTSHPFGPVNPRHPRGKDAFPLETVDVELVPNALVRDYRISYAGKMLNKPIKSLDVLTALEVFRKVPTNVLGVLLKGRIYLQANLDDEKFDPDYISTIQPNIPFDPKSTNPFRVTIEDIVSYPCKLDHNRKSRFLNFVFENNPDSKNAWQYLVEEYIPGCVSAGYDYVPQQENHIIAEIFAEIGNVQSEQKKVVSPKDQILVIRPNEIRQGSEYVFSLPLITLEVDKAMRDIIDQRNRSDSED